MRKICVVMIVLFFSIFGYSATKKIVYENLTGAWCGWCPRAVEEIKEISKLYPDQVIGITVHGGDAMQNPSSLLLYNKAKAYPNMSVNRGSTEPTDHSTIFAYEQSLKNGTSDVFVQIKPEWDKKTRKISGFMHVTFENNPPSGDLRLALIIVENSVVGTGSDYDQSNAFDAVTTYPNLTGAGNPIKGYKHYMVMRDCPNGVYGKSGVLPTSPLAGVTYSETIDYTLPLKFNNLNVQDTNIYLVAIAALNNGSIYSADRVRLKDASSSIILNTNTDKKMNDIEINFTKSGFQLNIHQPSHYKISVFDMAGRNLLNLERQFSGTGNYDLVIPAERRSSVGMYILTVSGQSVYKSVRQFFHE